MTVWEATYIDSADRVCNDIVLGLTALSLASLGLVWVHMVKTMPAVRIIKPNDEPIHLIFWLLLSAVFFGLLQLSSVKLPPHGKTINQLWPQLCQLNSFLMPAGFVACPLYVGAFCHHLLRKICSVERSLTMRWYHSAVWVGSCTMGVLKASLDAQHIPETKGRCQYWCSEASGWRGLQCLPIWMPQLFTVLWVAHLFYKHQWGELPLHGNPITISRVPPYATAMFAAFVYIVGLWMVVQVFGLFGSWLWLRWAGYIAAFCTSSGGLAVAAVYWYFTVRRSGADQQELFITSGDIMFVRFEDADLEDKNSHSWRREQSKRAASKRRRRAESLIPVVLSIFDRHEADPHWNVPITWRTEVCRWIVDEEERDATELLSDPVELEALIKRWKDRRVKLQTRRPTGLNDREDSDTDSDSDGDNSEGVVDSACKLDDEEVVNLEIRHCVTPWSCGPNCSGSCRVGNR